MKLTDLKEKKLSDLKEIAKTMGIEKISTLSKDELMQAMVSATPT
jgi:transcription termination factor Rho